MMHFLTIPKFIVGSIFAALIWFYLQAEDSQLVEWQIMTRKQEKLPVQTLAKNSEAEVAPIKEVSETINENMDLAPDIIGASQNFAALGFGNSEGGVSGVSGVGAMDNLVRETKGSRLARLVEQASLVFPSEARKQNISGFVNVKILIGISGAIDKVEIISATPPGVFEKSAVESIKKWKFEPAFSEGQAQASWITQKIKFELE